MRQNVGPLPTSSHQSSDDTSAADPLPAPPFSRSAHVQLVRREVREYIPRAALELLFRTAEVVFEGDVAWAEDGGVGAVNGTVMVTIDLVTVEGLCREPADAATAVRLAELLPAAEGFLEALQGLAARAMASKGAPVAPERVAIDTKIRVVAHRILIDADMSMRAAEGS